MRDNIRLDTNVFYPASAGSASRFPTVLVRTPYGKGADLPAGYQSFINHGYAVVMQDVRGRYGSGGVFDVLNQEGPDGYDTLNWIAAQPWSDGKVGMIGGSYLGIAQWQVALLNNPHLKAIFPVVSGSDEYFDRYYSRRRSHEAGTSFVVDVAQPDASWERQAEVFGLHLPPSAADCRSLGHAPYARVLPDYFESPDL